MCLKVVVLGQHLGPYQFLLQNVDKRQQVLRLVVTYIIYGVWRQRQSVFALTFLGSSLHDAHHPLDNIVDVGEVALAVAEVEYLDGLALLELIGKSEVGHIRPSGRTVDREEPESRRRYVVELGIGMRHQLVRLLRGGIERDGIVNLVVRTVGHFLIRPVNRRRTGVDQMLDGEVTAGLQDVVKTYQVRLDVSIGVGNRIAHTGLSSQIDNHLGLVFAEDGIDGSLVGDVAFDKLPGRTLWNCVVQFPEPELLQGHVVVVVHIVDTNDCGTLSVFEQTFHQVAANESGSTSHENRFMIQINFFHISL